MDSSLLIILVMAPGMIGIATSSLFNGESKPESVSDSLIKYFLFSVTAWILAELFCPGYVMSKVLQGLPLNTIDLFWPILIATIIGPLWVLFLEKNIMIFVNYINIKVGKNSVFLETSIFKKMFDDNEYHFLEVIKDGVSLGKGYLEHYQGNEKALSLIDDSEYDGHISHSKKYVIYLDNGLVIREYGYSDLSEEQNKEN